jgi:hypothetical protein
MTAFEISLAYSLSRTLMHGHKYALNLHVSISFLRKQSEYRMHMLVLHILVRTIMYGSLLQNLPYTF